MWQFQQTGNHEGSSLVNSDMTPNKAGEAYPRLYHQEWKSSQTIKPTTTTESAADFSFRGFKGKYDCKLVQHGQTIYFGEYELLDDAELMCIKLSDDFQCNY